MRRRALGLAIVVASSCHAEISCNIASANAFSTAVPLRRAPSLFQGGAIGKLKMHNQADVVPVMERLRGGESLAAKLAELGQGHLLDGLSDDKRAALLAQAEELNAQLPGGIEGYVKTARKLLQDSKDGVNPFLGFTPAVPQGKLLDPASEEFLKMEAVGLDTVSHTGFILVAGGLGERLGYNGIKVSLPLYDTERDKCFISLYIQHILDLQRTHGKGRTIPLAIMTSDDTHALTEQLLKDNSYFGMSQSQITIMKQNKVPSLENSSARIAVKDGVISTKPHGHGDVHTLMHMTGTAQRWLDGGVKYIVFFQDTNGIIFRALPSVLGVSVTDSLAVNSVCVPRTPGEAVGGICKLTHEDGRVVTVNVEYNQLDPLLKASSEFSEGDVADPGTGCSKFPGNINILAMHLPTYKETLERTGGRVNEFVNPKYVDSSKTAFKSATRLECMMQDFPLLLSKDASVGFTTLPRDMCFSPVKNNVKDAAAKQVAGLPIECAASAERDAYAINGLLLRLAGAHVDPGTTSGTYGGMDIKMPALVTLLPSFGTCLSDVKRHLSPDAKISVSARSALVLDGEIDIQGTLELDGALEIRAVPGSKVVIKNLKVHNKGWHVEATDEESDVLTAMRGFKVVKQETESKVYTESGVHVIDHWW